MLKCSQKVQTVDFATSQLKRCYPGAFWTFINYVMPVEVPGTNAMNGPTDIKPSWLGELLKVCKSSFFRKHSTTLHGHHIALYSSMPLACSMSAGSCIVVTASCHNKVPSRHVIWSQEGLLFALQIPVTRQSLGVSVVICVTALQPMSMGSVLFVTSVHGHGVRNLAAILPSVHGLVACLLHKCLVA